MCKAPARASPQQRSLHLWRISETRLLWSYAARRVRRSELHRDLSVTLLCQPRRRHRWQGEGSETCLPEHRTAGRGCAPTKQRAQIDPRPTPARPQVGPGSIPGRDPGSTPHRPKAWGAATSWVPVFPWTPATRAAARPPVAAIGATPWAAAIPLGEGLQAGGLLGGASFRGLLQQ